MITKEIAVKAGEFNSDVRKFHYTGKHDCSRHIGSHGGVKDNVTIVRPSGKCKVWVRSPERFHLPIKYGMYESYWIDQNNAQCFHLPKDCPLAHGENITDERNVAREGASELKFNQDCENMTIHKDDYDIVLDCGFRALDETESNNHTKTIHGFMV